MFACTAAFIALCATEEGGTCLETRRVSVYDVSGWYRRSIALRIFLKFAYPVKLSDNIAKGQEERGKEEATRLHRVTGI